MPAFAQLLADLALAGVSAHTRAAVVRRVAEVLAAQPIERVELGWCDASGSTAATVVATRRSRRMTVRRRTRVLRGTEVQEALRSGRPRREPTLVLPLGERGYAELAPGPPWSDEELASVAAVLRVAHRHCETVGRVARASRRAHTETAALRQRLERLEDDRDVVAESPAMRAALDRLDVVAEHDTPVLLQGPSGCGKSLLARRLHLRSARAAQPLVTVSCAALPGALIESELFGHVPGAFTGAGASPRRGRFARAHGGTLFLDEVAELPLEAQAKLLVALQDGVIEPVGSDREEAVDVRVVAATHQDLSKRVADGRFREDLYYRLAVFPIAIPPLRERPEDLPLLIDRQLRDLARRHGREPLRISARALRRLARHAWPGNVRELRNVIERAAILSRGKRLELEEAFEAPPSAGFAGDVVRTFDAAATAAIEAALRAARGKLYGDDGAAALLGLKPSTLQTKMRKYGIERRRFVRGDD